MYKRKRQPIKSTSLNVNVSTEGETIEQKLHRIIHNGEPITDGAPLIFTEKSKGVEPAYDIRTDRWEIAIEANDSMQKSIAAKKSEQNKPADDKADGSADAKGESIQATK